MDIRFSLVSHFGTALPRNILFYIIMLGCCGIAATTLSFGIELIIILRLDLIPSGWSWEIHRGRQMEDMTIVSYCPIEDSSGLVHVLSSTGCNDLVGTWDLWPERA